MEAAILASLAGLPAVALPVGFGANGLSGNGGRIVSRAVMVAVAVKKVEEKFP